MKIWRTLKQDRHGHYINFAGPYCDGISLGYMCRHWRSRFQASKWPIVKNSSGPADLITSKLDLEMQPLLPGWAVFHRSWR
ncbi:hypothetical protein DTO164E3_4943 [Paecilomyces variotii]|nr:hypothetical protein DTO164E3_4943 [Paecilomyces variotii]KAJ9410375.1 hypothetical protein DTO045G8_1838 [Paecilomyces variotii]